MFVNPWPALLNRCVLQYMLNFLPLNWICHCFLDNNILKRRKLLPIDHRWYFYLHIWTVRFIIGGYFFNRCKYVIHVHVSFSIEVYKEKYLMGSNKQGKKQTMYQFFGMWVLFFDGFLPLSDHLIQLGLALTYWV